VYTGFWWGNLRERAHFEDPGVDRRIILRWIFRKWDVGHGLDRAGSGEGQVTGPCEGDDKPSIYVKCWEFLV
jgi:hypothetical protein